MLSFFSPLLVSFSLAHPAACGERPTPEGSTEPLVCVDPSPLFDELSKIDAIRAHYLEEKKISLLTKPLQSEGTIYFKKSIGLARHTLRPKAQKMVLTESLLSFWDGKKIEKLPLNQTPLLKTFSIAFLQFLKANKTALEGSFTLRFCRPKLEEKWPLVSGNRWTLLMTPSSPELLKILEQIMVTGKGANVDLFEIRESNGDSTKLKFTEVDAHVHFSENEQSALFNLP